MRVQRFSRGCLFYLRRLGNLHVASALPGWIVPEPTLLQHLERDLGEYIVDPWVSERDTICAVDGYRVLAAAHLLRYRDVDEVSAWCRGAGTIAWLLAIPGEDEAAAAVLAAAHGRFSDWSVTQAHGWDTGLPAGPLAGVPDIWPHIAAALTTAGYRPDSAVHREVVYGRWLWGVAAPGEPPIAGLGVVRTVGPDGTRFTAHLGETVIGSCEALASDPWRGSVGWAELWSMEVKEEWRGRGVGTWLLCHAVAWLRLAGCDRIALAVTEEDELAGAGRFYQRFGWDVFARETLGWTRTAN